MYPTGILIALLVLVVVVLLAVCIGCTGHREVASEAFYQFDEEDADVGGAPGGAIGGGHKLQYFKMDGCPHCERFDKVWEDIERGGLADVMELQKLDSRSPEASEHKVRGFPHVQVVTADGRVVVYQGKRDQSSIEEFARSSVV
jgi:hypothetical protein